MIEDVDCWPESPKKELKHLTKEDKIILALLYKERVTAQDWLMDIDERIMRIENGKTSKQD